VVDYSETYPERLPDVICRVTYAQLKSGFIEVEGKTVPSTPLSSYSCAQEIAGTLKDWIAGGKFEITAPAAPIPGADSGLVMGPMPDHPIRKSSTK
jgi:uncharacterized protein (DUF39 family)